MAEFKFGDMVEITDINGLIHFYSMEQGDLAVVLQADNPCTDSFPVRICNGKGECTWARSDALTLRTSTPDEVVAATTEGQPETTPIDLPTVKLIYQQWETILGMDGITDDAAANVFSGYISGLMQGLKGDFDA